MTNSFPKKTKAAGYDGVFKVDKEGNHVYFPNGVMGKGYEVSSREEREKIRKLQKRFFLGLMIILGITVPFGGMLLFGVIAIPYALIFHLRVKKILRDLPESDARLTMADVKTTFAQSLPTGVLWITEIFFLFIFAGGMGNYFVSEERNLSGLFSSLLFGYFAYLIGRIIFIRRKSLK